MTTVPLKTLQFEKNHSKALVPTRMPSLRNPHPLGGQASPTALREPTKPSPLEGPSLSALVCPLVLCILAKPRLSLLDVSCELPSWRTPPAPHAVFCPRRVFRGHCGSDLPGKRAQIRSEAACSNLPPAVGRGCSSPEAGVEAGQPHLPPLVQAQQALFFQSVQLGNSEKAGLKKRPGHVYTSTAESLDIPKGQLLPPRFSWKMPFPKCDVGTRLTVDPQAQGEAQKGWTQGPQTPEGQRRRSQEADKKAHLFLWGLPG